MIVRFATIPTLYIELITSPIGIKLLTTLTINYKVKVVRTFGGAK
jgi:hypothetical protein